MKLMIRERYIHEIPTLEVVGKEMSSEALPLVVLYHGWRNTKELMLSQARRLANQGFRVVVPDAMHHGERKSTGISSIPGLTFWSSIQYNLMEFSLLVDFFKARDWILDERVGVAGYSMGGITAAAILTQHPEVKVAASIMGTPKPELYVQGIFSSVKARQIFMPKDLPLALSWIPNFDLSLMPEKIANRPVLFWHGTEDEKIPYEQVADFYESVQDKPYAAHTTFWTGEGEGHLVDLHLMDRIAAYFAENL